MGIGNFFRNVWGGAKKGATKVFGGLKKGAEFIGRIAKPISHLAEGAGKLMGVLPGKIGQFGRALNQGGAFVRQLTNELPNSDVKNKLNEALNKGESIANNYTNRAQKYAENIRDSGQPWLKAGSSIINKIGGMATDFANH